MLAVVRSKPRFLRAARHGVCLSLGVSALACSIGDDDGDGGGSAGSSGKGGSAPVMTSAADAQIYVDAHNAVRAAVQKPTTYSGAWSDVPPVIWSDEIAITAQQWANHLRDTMGCGLMHADGTGYGENLAAGTNIGAQRAVDMWSSEIDNYTYSPSYEFTPNTGHYIQIVWRNTTEIGCAGAKCSGSSVVVCRYSPPGNYLGQQPY
jgi:pathogenesis-related protein 1